MNSEAAFIFSTFNEFYKCWKSGANARLFIESVKGKAFINLSAFLGYPEDAHFKPQRSKRNPSKLRKKSAKKIQRDKDRAARYNAEKKRREEEAASASEPVDNPEATVTSSPGAVSAMTVSDQEFTFASPVPENLRQDQSQDTSMIMSDKKEQKQEDEEDNIKSLPANHVEENTDFGNAEGSSPTILKKPFGSDGLFGDQTKYTCTIERGQCRCKNCHPSDFRENVLICYSKKCSTKLTNFHEPQWRLPELRTSVYTAFGKVKK